MEQNSNNIVDIRYQQTGEASATNELGMREMQAKAYASQSVRHSVMKCQTLCDVASEPVGGYIATGSGYVSTIDDPMEENEDCGISDDWDPGIGPYTMEELNARIEEADAAIDRAEAGDMSDWVTSEEMDRRLYERFPWLMGRIK